MLDHLCCSVQPIDADLSSMYGLVEESMPLMQFRSGFNCLFIILRIQMMPRAVRSTPHPFVFQPACSKFL
ncbi:hypothetical protein Y032_0907g2979 [Ancylostoma ceylanicum]|uniref:Uncharacterized protein n=1 Tax=Ancylostoma ceylanicum TaxID=53326 RepID=A0A016W9N4_9BILA|nr:hypothetical protein Y032_0907g2979 [Ancylostoma ceylanicum]